MSPWHHSIMMCCILSSMFHINVTFSNWFLILWYFVSFLVWGKEHIFLSWWQLVMNFVERIGRMWRKNTRPMMRKIYCDIASLQHTLLLCFMTVLVLLWMMRGIFDSVPFNRFDSFKYINWLALWQLSVQCH